MISMNQKKGWFSKPPLFLAFAIRRSETASNLRTWTAGDLAITATKRPRYASTVRMTRRQLEGVGADCRACGNSGRDVEARRSA